MTELENKNWPGAETEKSSDELRAEVARTRERLAQDVEAIGQKLSPDNIKREARDAVTRSVRHGVRQGADAVRHGAGVMRTRVNDAGTSLAGSARENPLPLALIGAGIGWLIWNARKRSQHVDYYAAADYDYPLSTEEPFGYEVGGYSAGGAGTYGYGAQAGYGAQPGYGVQAGYGAQTAGTSSYDQYGRVGYAAEDGSTEPSRVEELKDRARGVAAGAKDKVQNLTGRARSGMNTARDSARDRAYQVRDRARLMQQRAREQAVWARGQARHQMDENPMAVGLLAVAAGIGVGLLLPTTERENRWMGDRRDRLVDRVKEKASEAGQIAQESARRVAQNAKETVKDEAQRRGFVSGQAQQGSEAGQQSSGDVSVHEVKPVGETWGSSFSSSTSAGPNGRTI